MKSRKKSFGQKKWAFGQIFGKKWAEKNAEKRLKMGKKRLKTAYFDKK